MNAMVKYLKHIPSMELVFFRSVGSSILATGYLLKDKTPLFGNK